MEWISVKERLPETTHSQHHEDFLSETLGIWTDEGFGTDNYRRTYDLKNGTGELLSEGWLASENVTHWMRQTNPQSFTNGLGCILSRI